MIYENYSFTSKNEVELLLKGNNEDVKKAIIGAVRGINEWEWLQNLCLRYIHHDDFWVAKTAIDGIGDIARIHRKLDVNKVKNDFNQISSSKLKPIISAVMDDIIFF